MKKPICVFCGGELGDGDDPNPPTGLVKHENVRECIVQLRTRIDWDEYDANTVGDSNRVR